MLLFKNRFECIVAEEQENLNVNGIMEGRELLVDRWHFNASTDWIFCDTVEVCADDVASK